MSESNPHVLGELSSYLDGALTPAETKRIDAHLKTCSGCQRHYSDLRSLRHMLRSGRTFKPSERFYQEVLQKIEQPQRRFSDFTWGLPVKAIASACVLLIGVWVAHEVRPAPRNLKAPAPIQEKAKNEAGAPKEANLARMIEQAPADAPPTAPAPAAVQRSEEAPLSERKDVVTQARDTKGAAAQNSFSDSEQFLGARQKQKMPSTEAAFALKDTSKTNADGQLAAAAGSSGAKREVIASSAIFPQWRGDTSGITVPRTVIIESPEAWQALWKEHKPSETPPPVDFARNIVIGVFAGGKGSGGYAIEITETKTLPGALLVLYHETVPAHNSGNIAVETQPYHLQVIPKSGLLIQFKKI